MKPDSFLKRLTSYSVLFTLIIALTALLIGEANSAGEVIIIAHSGVTVSSVSVDFLQKVYTGSINRWPDGMKLQPVMLESGGVHEDFLSTYIKKSISQFSQFWKSQIFTGKGIPPKSVSSEEAVVRFVTATEGAIGYISPATPHDGVKVIKVE